MKFFFLIFSFFCIIAVDSMSCLLLGLLSVFGFFMYRGVWKTGMEFRALALLSAMALTFMLVVFFMLHGGDGALASLLAGVNRDISLTGRVDLWEDVFTIAKGNWVLGKGYGAFWFEGMNNNLWEMYVWHPNQAHQGFLDIYVQLGAVGLALSLLWVGSVVVRRIKSSVLDSFDVFRLLFIVIIIFHNMVESSILRLNHIYWFLFLVIALDSLGEIEVCDMD